LLAGHVRPGFFRHEHGQHPRHSIVGE
jgi:hypothetical protein